MANTDPTAYIEQVSALDLEAANTFTVYLPGYSDDPRHLSDEL